MKYFLIFIITLFLFSCSKEKKCRLITVRTINGCVDPVLITTSIKDVEYCGEALVNIRKQNGKYFEFPKGNGVCRITTIVTEK